MTDLRLVVFDVDGTLVDSQHQISGAMTIAFNGAGHEAPSHEAVRNIVGLSLPVAVRTLAPHLPGEEADRIVDGYKAAFSGQREDLSAPLFAGAVEALEHLDTQPDLLLGVATGKSRRGLRHLLDAHDLDRFFVTQQVADDHPSKPHPSMLLATLRDTGVMARRGIMVGDTTYDMNMGRSAGFLTVGVTWGYHSADLLVAAGADVLVDGFADLGAALAVLWGR